jgi:nucleotide-binding universal stress UspA family protein
MIKTILVPIDGSSHASAAVDWASDLGQRYGARLVLLHVRTRQGSGLVPEELEPLARIEGVSVTEADVLQSVANRILADGAERARRRGGDRIETVSEIGYPPRAIIDAARRFGAELIVMGRRGLGGLPGILLGSVSSKVLHLADCACLTVK